MASVRYDDASVRKVLFKELRLAVFTWSVPWRNFELRKHPKRYLRNWTSAGPRFVRRILAASDPQLTLKARLRYGTATAEPTMPSLSEADIAVRVPKMPGICCRPGHCGCCRPRARTSRGSRASVAPA
ncbi:hypothetical protein [Streptomyces sp. NPDC026589]|uniref:hypothetical protein n=1 Tax=Streptomyces sp. NPDC026589 TaxID=3155609 RepID=UPI0033DC9228